MAAKEATKRPPLSAWQTGALRLTAFPSPSAQTKDIDWWNDVVGEQPDKRESRPRTLDQIEEGPYRNGKLTLSVSALRIDWVYEPIVPEPPSGATEIPTLGSFPRTIKVFRESMSKWFQLGTMPSLVRLAFGAILLQPVEDHVEGYELLSRYLKIDLDVEGSSDFFYQINRPRNSETSVPNLRINRLSKWSVSRFQKVLFSVSPASFTPSTVQRSKDLYACRLELDINTVPDFEDEFGRQALPKVFSELVDLGKEIAQKGDIK